MSFTEVSQELLANWPLPWMGVATDKDARGRVLLAGGGVEVPGALILAGVGALRSGAGKLQLATPQSLAIALGLSVPEARVFGLPQTAGGELAAEGAEELATRAQRSDAVVIGPGMLDEEAAGALAQRLALVEECALVVDAAAMVGLARAPEAARRKGGRLVLTPHAGEMAAMLDCARATVEADPVSAARGLAAELQAVVVMKNAVTYVVSPDGRAWRHLGGSPGLATSGSGDVLAGVIGGLLARGAAPAQAACWGVYAHGACGRRLAERIAPLGFLARELLDEIAPALAELTSTAPHSTAGARQLPWKV
ncbi:NAD(P)H-hydrate dehydratase [uncultured Phenylobacterium sp.]|uniref:NAD(P)H-hydrate dehydratase n=1 Tax=uncultured Phenylobacterium sp. TaxID=349273 RepID=UPI0025E9CC32|nr:NAD(P)H-hydrate dehydratase [uncultured Phenylobacterium sp.]